MSTKQTIGTNLSPWSSSVTRSITNNFLKVFKTMEAKAVLDTSIVKRRPENMFFTKAGVPAANTAADSPGADICFVWNTTGNDLYLIYDWVDSTHFKVQLIVGTA